jgi:hypothetical protein
MESLQEIKVAPQAYHQIDEQIQRTDSRPWDRFQQLQLSCGSMKSTASMLEGAVPFLLQTIVAQMRIPDTFSTSFPRVYTVHQATWTEAFALELRNTQTLGRILYHGQKADLSTGHRTLEQWRVQGTLHTTTSIKKRHLSMEWHEAANLDNDPIKVLTHSFWSFGTPVLVIICHNCN